MEGSSPALNLKSKRSGQRIGLQFCSNHGHRQPFDWRCVCDAGWSGPKCDVPAEQVQDVEQHCLNPGGEDAVATCDWYSDCLSERFPSCESHTHEYAESYGGRFCQAFHNKIDEFSQDGGIWVKKVMLCLQHALASTVMRENVTHPNCKYIRAQAFDSHPECYLEPVETDSGIGICSLLRHRFGDVVKIFEITWDALFSWESVKQMMAVAAGCAAKSLGALKASFERDGYIEMADVTEAF